jgi:hypothetical protein
MVAPLLQERRRALRARMVETIETTIASPNRSSASPITLFATNCWKRRCPIFGRPGSGRLRALGCPSLVRAGDCDPSEADLYELPRTHDPKAVSVWRSSSGCAFAPRAAPAYSGLHAKFSWRVIECPHGRESGRRNCVVGAVLQRSRARLLFIAKRTSAQTQYVGRKRYPIAATVRPISQALC